MRGGRPVNAALLLWRIRLTAALGLYAVGGYLDPAAMPAEVELEVYAAGRHGVDAFRIAAHS